MERIGWFLYLTTAVNACGILTENDKFSLKYCPSRTLNNSVDATRLQLTEFRMCNPEPIGLLTQETGPPVDIRQTISLNSDQYTNYFFLKSFFQFDAQRIPPRVVHSKGTGAFGYFEVTHDVSRYTTALVFNGIGKKTPLVTRFSAVNGEKGDSDLLRNVKGFAIKFYTEDGILDITAVHIPVFFFVDPFQFLTLINAVSRNPVTNVYDNTAVWDFVTLRPFAIHAYLYTQSDYGLPDGFRKMDAFAIHTFELINKYGESHFCRFNLRTGQGLANLTSEQAAEIQAIDTDYFTRDLYNAIAKGSYPYWNLEMDILTREEIETVGYDPFDITRNWERGTYNTVQIGRIVLNENLGNQFRDAEQAAYHPSNLVPGIPGPIDAVYKARAFSYRDAQHHRLGLNHNKITINSAENVKNYIRDGAPPIQSNMGSSPNYFPNSFSGPVPYVDELRPRERLELLQSSTVDLQPAHDFYNKILIGEGPKNRLAENLATSLAGIDTNVMSRAMKLLSLVDIDLGRRVKDQLMNQM